MKFFIDTANLNEIKEAYDLGVLDGVTTNPSLMAKENIKGQANVLAHYKAICNIVDNNVSAEVIATDYEGILKEGRELAKIDGDPRRVQEFLRFRQHHVAEADARIPRVRGALGYAFLRAHVVAERIAIEAKLQVRRLLFGPEQVQKARAHLRFPD